MRGADCGKTKPKSQARRVGSIVNNTIAAQYTIYGKFDRSERQAARICGSHARHVKKPFGFPSKGLFDVAISGSLDKWIMFM
jgi:hypothetical protein